MTSSVVDSRSVPNHPRTIQGTVDYDVIPVESRAVPALTPSYAITSVANASAGNTDYTGTFTVANIPVSSDMEIAGFVGAVNNGVFQVVAVTSTTLTLANAFGAAETQAATAVPYIPVDSRTGSNIPVDSRASINVPQNSRA